MKKWKLFKNKKVKDKHLENKRKNENERQKIYQAFLIDRINKNNNFLEEMNRIKEIYKYNVGLYKWYLSI